MLLTILTPHLRRSISNCSLVEKLYERHRRVMSEICFVLFPASGSNLRSDTPDDCP